MYYNIMLDIATASVITLPVFSLFYPAGIAVDAAKNVYVADGNCIQRINPAGTVTTFAGARGSGFIDGLGTAARFTQPQGIAFDSAGNLFVADTGNHTIRRISVSGDVTTVAGTAGQSGSADGWPVDVRFNYPHDIAVDGAGNVFVADTYNHVIRRFNTVGGVIVTTVAGRAGVFGSTNGTGSAARFHHPSGIAIDGSGTLYVADTYNHVIRRIDTGGNVTTIAGRVEQIGSTNGTGTDVRFNTPWGIAVDSSGNIYIADYGNHLIRRIDTTGNVTTLAGGAGLIGNTNGPVVDARFNGPDGIAVDNAGNVFVSERGNGTVRMISSNLIQLTGITGLTLQNKVYDGTTTVPFTSLIRDSAVYQGKLVSDVLSIASATVTFASSAVGNNKVAQLTNIVLGGNGSSYTPPSIVQITGNIIPKQLTGITGVTLQNKVYDGTTTVPFASLNRDSAVYQDKMDSDTLTIVSATVTFASSAAGNNKVAQLTNIVLGGNGSSYTPPSIVQITGNIIPKHLTGITGLTLQNKVYDGTTTVPFASLIRDSAVYQGKLDSDVLTIVSATVTFASSAVGNNKFVQLTNIVLGGNGSFYTPPRIVQITGNILPAKPSVPRNVSVNTPKMSVSGIAYKWLAPVNKGGVSLLGYSVLVRKVGVLLSPQPKTVFNGESVVITGLAKNTLYAVAVAAKNAAGIGAYSPFVQGKTLAK